MLSLATTVALGYGTSQAPASPGAENDSARRLCSPVMEACCLDWCVSMGYDTGWCDRFGWPNGCRCHYYYYY